MLISERLNSAFGLMINTWRRYLRSPVNNPSLSLNFPVRADAFKFIEKCSEQFDFIFADPPYALKDLQSIPGRIFENGLLKENGLLVLEHGKDQNFEDDPHFIERRIYGSVNFSFFRATVPEAE